MEMNDLVNSIVKFEENPSGKTGEVMLQNLEKLWNSKVKILSDSEHCSNMVDNKCCKSECEYLTLEKWIKLSDIIRETEFGRAHFKK